MEDSLMTETAETCMTVDNLYLLADYDVAKDWKEGKHGWEGSLSVDDEEWYVVDFETIGEVSDSSAALVCMSDYDDLVSSIDKFLYVTSEIHADVVVVHEAYRRKLVNVTLDSSYQKSTTSLNMNCHLNLPGCGKKKSLTILHIVSSKFANILT
jgi:hypothetical protein